MQRERQTKTETQTDRQTDRQRQKQRETETDRQTERQTDRQSDKQTDKEIGQRERDTHTEKSLTVIYKLLFFASRSMNSLAKLTSLCSCCVKKVGKALSLTQSNYPQKNLNETYK